MIVKTTDLGGMTLHGDVKTCRFQRSVATGKAFVHMTFRDGGQSEFELTASAYAMSDEGITIDKIVFQQK